MTRTVLLECLKSFTENAVGDIIMPVRQQKEDREPPPPRPAAVHLMGLAKGAAEQKAVPYIVHQLLAGKDSQAAGSRPAAVSVVRSLFCVYSEYDEEGGLLLLGLMERLRVAMMRQVLIGKQFQLNLEEGLEALIYPDNTAPYYIGEMISTWMMPGIKREAGVY